MALLLIIFGLKNLGTCVAREIWLPKIVENQKALYEYSAYVIDHDGWNAEQIKIKDTMKEPGKIEKNNWKQAESGINQIEQLLDIKPRFLDLKKRAENLKKFFDN